MFCNLKLQDLNTILIVVLGKSLVGKTSLLYKYFFGHALKSYETFEEDQFYYCESPYSSIKLVDLLEDNNFQIKLDNYILKATGFLLVFAINDLDSFNKIKEIYSDIKKKRKKKIPILLVGNKCDLNAQRQVQKIDGKKFAKSIGGYYLEVSAMENVDIMINTLADLLLGNIGGVCACC